MANSLKLPKIRLNPYTKHLLKENAPYLAIGGVLIILTIFAVPVVFNKYSEHAQKATQLEREVQELGEKARTLDTLLQETPEDLSQDVEIMQALIPDFEDYFSFIYTLDELSQKTNFIITSYGINVEKSKEGVLSLAITGIGDEEAFIEFLRQYNFGGGRLITVSSVSLGGEAVEEGSVGGVQPIGLDVSFYSKNVNVKDSTGVNYKKSLSRLQELKNRISFVVREPEQQEGGGKCRI